MISKLFYSFRIFIGYFILITSFLFMIMWNFSLWLIYGVIGFNNWSEFLFCTGFSIVSAIILFLIDVLCSKVLPSNFNNLCSIFFE